ncbi:MAG: beta-galactosidase [Tepidiformaceae bacterium]
MPRRPSRRVFVAFCLLGAGALAALAMLATMAVVFVQLSWPHAEALGNPQFGINFSCRQAEYLLLEDPAKGPAGYVDRSRPGRAQWCADTLGTILDGTGAKHVRISVVWWEVEPQPGVYDFSVLDAELARAQQSGAKVLLGIGVKAQRHPEYYIPDWATARVTLTHGEVVSDDPYLASQALAMVAAVTAHVAGSPTIEAWAADNEPYVASNRADDWTLSRQFARAEEAAIKANDPAHRLVSINFAQHFVFDRGWQDALADGDALGVSIYPFRNYELFGHNFVVPILEIGPLAPNYAAQARAAHVAGKPFWITEMQAEPWADIDLRLISPQHPSANLTPKKFEQSIDYARRTGADRVYLWGAEWWLYERDHFGDSRWWDMARAVLEPSP